MKANRKHLETFANEDAVSPVIAVILMVAITVVLAATVFVLVNDLGKNVGSTGPSLGLVTDSAQSSNSNWVVKASSATKLADLTDYKFVIQTPSNGSLVFTPQSNDFTAGDAQNASAGPANTDRKTFAATDLNGAVAWRGFKLTITDIDGNSKFSVGDTMNFTYDKDTYNTDFDDVFPSGEYTFEVLHTPSGSSAGSLPRTVG